MTLGTSTPALADHRDVGDGECSWFPDQIPFVYNFHEACVKHDACGEIVGSDQLAWDECDELLYNDALDWCWLNNPLSGHCFSAAAIMYWGLRAYVNGTRDHRD
jgi:hypothetical protein